MKIYQETVTRREGEWLGPIDYFYDWDQYNVYPNNLETRHKKADLIKEIESLFLQGKKIFVYDDPLICGELLKIGMYDGWPFWKPTPACLVKHWYGGDVVFWYSIQNYEIMDINQS